MGILGGHASSPCSQQGPASFGLAEERHPLGHFFGPLAGWREGGGRELEAAGEEAVLRGLRCIRLFHLFPLRSMSSGRTYLKRRLNYACQLWSSQ